MRFILPVLLAGCAANPALERRVAELEKRPSSDALEARIAVLEQRLREVPAEPPATVASSETPAAKPVEPKKFVAPLPEEFQVEAQWVPPPTPPSPTKIYAVPIEDSPVLAGDANAWLTIVAGVQFPEPYTHKAMPMLAQLKADYGKNLRIVTKSYVVHAQATDSTIAGCAMALQQKLEKFEAALWTAKQAKPQPYWPDAKDSRDVAAKAGADLAAFDRDITRCTTMKSRDMKTLASMGQHGVPVFWINGRMITGAQPIANFKAILDEEAKKADADRAKGGQVTTYYQRTTGAP